MFWKALGSTTASLSENLMLSSSLKKPGISRTSINCLEKGAKNEMNQSKITDRLLPCVFDRL